MFIWTLDDVIFVAALGVVILGGVLFGLFACYCYIEDWVKKRIAKYKEKQKTVAYWKKAGTFTMIDYEDGRNICACPICQSAKHTTMAGYNYKNKLVALKNKCEDCGHEGPVTTVQHIKEKLN